MSACDATTFNISATQCLQDCNLNPYLNISYFEIIEQINYCTSSCDYPNGLLMDSSISLTTYECTLCPSFYERATMKCLSSCPYQNVTTSGGVTY